MATSGHVKYSASGLPRWLAKCRVCVLSVCPGDRSWPRSAGVVLWTRERLQVWLSLTNFRVVMVHTTLPSRLIEGPTIVHQFWIFQFPVGRTFVSLLPQNKIFRNLWMSHKTLGHRPYCGVGPITSLEYGTNFLRGKRSMDNSRSRPFRRTVSRFKLNRALPPSFRDNPHFLLPLLHCH